MNVNATTYKESDYDGDADAFIVFCQENDGLYYVPVSDASSGKMLLRIEPCKNGQRAGINWADDFEFAPDDLFTGP
jgi:hypothetical protein